MSVDTISCVLPEFGSVSGSSLWFHNWNEPGQMKDSVLCDILLHTGDAYRGAMPSCSLVDTSVVGTRSARELAALGPGTMLCDGNAYIFTFLAAASKILHPAPCL